MGAAQTHAVVTGGAGFIGSHVVDALLERRYRVTVIDDLSSGSRDNLRHHLDNPDLRLVVASVLDAAALEAAMAGADFVLHLAVRNVRLSLRRPTVVHEVNATGTLNALKAAVRVKAARFLYCSSSEVNGTAGEMPMPEEYTYRPETVYGASKLAGEYYAGVFHRSGWLRTVVARPHNNYGPRAHFAGSQGELIPRFALLALAGKPLPVFGDGSQTRDFTYVTETAAILVDLIESERAFGGTFNVCRGEPVSVDAIARMVVQLTGSTAGVRRLPPRPSDVLRLWGDPARLAATIGRVPRISIAEGLARTVSWYRDNVPLSESVLDSLAPENWAAEPCEPWLADALAQPHAEP